jgi:hypothetical protein
MTGEGATVIKATVVQRQEERERRGKKLKTGDEK